MANHQKTIRKIVKNKPFLILVSGLITISYFVLAFFFFELSTMVKSWFFHLLILFGALGGLGVLIAKFNRFLSLGLSIVFLSYYLFFLSVAIPEHWCYPPQDPDGFANHMIRPEVYTNYFSGRWSAYGIYHSSCNRSRGCTGGLAGGTARFAFAPLRDGIRRCPDSCGLPVRHSA